MSSAWRGRFAIASSGSWCGAAIDGFSLHAGVRVEAQETERLEQLYRYVTRPPVVTECLSPAPDGKVTHRLRHAWRDGTTHVVFSLLAFLERPAALVPHPSAHLSPTTDSWRPRPTCAA
ncbi:MAG TPA: hypothetical protein ENJ09_06830 [Planctomycetes bacterium]|nr:hypothetical protein [Planctomycetota bacterium]